MKKVFFGLLIIAAGAGIFYYLRKQNKPLSTIDIQKDWLIGSWKLDSLDFGKDSNSTGAIFALLDSNLYKYRYEFSKDNAVHVTLHDSLTADSSKFVWGKKDELIFQNDLFNKAPDSLHVTTLTADSLIVRDRDSVFLFFTKAK